MRSTHIQQNCKIHKNICSNK